jgi:6-pyruvoyltetrahydropterin/6-carboxytetrahydropterin synthase
VLELTRKMELSASHRLWRGDWSDERNRQVYGPEAGERVFGHNYALEVTLAGKLDPETGMVIDLKALQEIMDREIGDRFDHRNLNEDTPFFRDRAPTPESFAAVIFALLDEALPGELLRRVRLAPTDDLWVEVSR